jgi:pSer/pThr/pTyr-binding forkhead associated (FHA) protein
MLQIALLTGKKSGPIAVIDRFPWIIGRSQSADYCLTEGGVWDRHLRVGLDFEKGFTLELLEGALGTLNGEPFRQAILKNGDVLVLGSAKIQLWLSEVRPRAGWWKEWLTWISILLLTAFQIWLISWVGGLH